MSKANYQPHIVRNIWAVGRNYADHAKELNNEVPTTPLIFLKSGNCITSSSLLHLPSWSKVVHHEIELAFWLDENMEFSHFTLALDLTARDAQTEAKQKGHPWTLAKSFTGSCPLAPWISLTEISSLDDIEFDLKINGAVRQMGRFTDMLLKPKTLLKHIRDHYPVTPYDVILTGTPSGVASLKSGDRLEASISDKSQSKQQPLLICHWDIN
ncbi:MAG: fumarylacetoacetate hydrolase family protein [Pseudobdellovibrio sp.]